MEVIMRLGTLGIILAGIGLIGALIGYASIVIFNDVCFIKMGLLGNGIQVVGLVLISSDRGYKSED
jgi:hypothetical protein